jgi:hypothetical protein
MPNPERRKKGNDPIYELTLRIRILPQLLRDRRIKPFLKVLPFLGLTFVLFPSLIISIPFAIIFVLMGFYLFYELSPHAVVEGYLATLRKTIPGEWMEKERKDRNKRGE